MRRIFTAELVILLYFTVFLTFIAPALEGKATSAKLPSFIHRHTHVKVAKAWPLVRKTPESKSAGRIANHPAQPRNIWHAFDNLK